MRVIIFFAILLVNCLFFGNVFSLDQKEYKYLAGQIDRCILVDKTKSIIVLFKSKPEELFNNVIFIKNNGNLIISSMDYSKKVYTFPLKDIVSVLDAKTRSPISENEFEANQLLIMGTMQYQLDGDYDGAADSFKKVIALTPQCSEAYHNLGLCLERKGLFDEAAKEFKKYLELSGNHKSVGARRICLSKADIDNIGNNERDMVLNKLVDGITDKITSLRDYTFSMPTVREALNEALDDNIYSDDKELKDCRYFMSIACLGIDKDNVELKIGLSSAKKAGRNLEGKLTCKNEGIISGINTCFDKLLSNISKADAIEADSFSYETEPRAKYVVKTLGDEKIIFEITFTGIDDFEAKSENPFIKVLNVITPKPAGDGAKTVVVRSIEGKEIYFQTTVKSGKEEKIRIWPDMPQGCSNNCTETLNMKSEGGYLLELTAAWKNAKIDAIRIVPAINPFGPIEINCEQYE